MSIVTDGPRSDRWVAFAKQKLAQIKRMGILAKNVLINGFMIRISQSDGIDKINITAPPVFIASHKEALFNGGVGMSLYYSSPYGAPAVNLGGMGGLDNLVANGVIRNDLYDDAQPGNFSAPGSGAIFSTPADLFYTAWALTAVSPFRTMGSVSRRFADSAAVKVSTIGTIQSDAGVVIAGWALSVQGRLFTALFGTGLSGLQAYFPPAYTGTRDYSGTQSPVFIYTDGANASFDLVQEISGLVIPGATQNPVWVRGAYLYASPTAGSVRLMIVISSATGGGSTALVDHATALFYDYDQYLTRTSVGSATLDGIVPFNAIDLVLVTRQLFSRSPNDYNSCLYADGVGGVNWAIHVTTGVGNDITRGGVYNITPTTATAVRNNTGIFPPPAEGAREVWPTVFRGEDLSLCTLETRDNAPSGDAPACAIVGLYKGSAYNWISMPMPPSGVLLAVRPVKVSAGSIILLGILYDSSSGVSGSYIVDFDSATGWTTRGLLTTKRMVRPIVGVFGLSPHSVNARLFNGVFPICNDVAASQPPL